MTSRSGGKQAARSESVFDAGSVKVVQIAQFLPAEARDSLYESACASRALFLPPGGAGAPVETTLHWSENPVGGGKPESGPLTDALAVMSEHILDCLPSIFSALGIESFPVTRIPLNLIHGLDGHSGSTHADSTNGLHVISLLYYFNSVPKMFRGGDLELFETDSGSPSGHGEKAFAKIEIEDNLLLAFESNTFHGVTDVQCDSEEFADGRFVAVAFL